MKVLVIGDTSVVGARIRAKLKGRHEILTAGRSGAADIPFDLGRSREPTSIPTVDAIVHCAASFQPGSLEGMLANEEANAVGAFRVAQLAQEAGCKHIVLISTISIFDHPDNGYFGTYGLSKRHGQENLKLWCRQAGIAFTAVLPSQIYDEEGKERKHQGLLYHIADCARRPCDVTLYGNADPLRNYLYVDDLVEAVERILVRRAAGTFACLAPDSHRLSEVVNLAFEVFGTKGQVIRLRDKPDIPGIHIPDDDSLFGATGYRPATTLREGLARIRDHGRGG